MHKLTNDQLKQLADFESNLSIVFAAAIISPLFSHTTIDSITLLQVVLGLGAAVASLCLSLTTLRLLKKGKR